MGCVSSNSSASGGEDHPSSNPDELLRQAQAQRRRLSVTPALVGDIEGKRINPSEGRSRRLSLGVAPDNTTFASNANGDETATGEHFFAISKKGFVPYNRKKQNQDAFIVHHNIEENDGVSLYGVCDGHGEFGHFVSGFVKKHLISNLGKQAELREKPEVAIPAAIEQLCNALEHDTINIAFSGTTLVFGLHFGNHMYVANIGDSRCVVARQEGEEYIAEPLSRDQKPDDPDEKERILKAGGRVEPLPGPPNEDLGPFRVWLAEVDVPGLAMSRSIGDEISHTVGVISEPEVTKYEISEKDRFFVWASDGVWEFLSNQEVVDLVRQSLPDLEKAATSLVELSSNKWREVEEVIDDITCIILTVNN